MFPWNKIAFDDDWIMSHYSYDSTWVELCKAYNEQHGVNINYSTFKYHCNHALNLRNSYHDGLTEEQETWLKEHYPVMGEKKAAEEFNRHFDTSILPGTIGTYCNRKLGLKVNEERKLKNLNERTIRLVSKRCHPIGTVMARGDEGYCIKTEYGWKRLSWQALGIDAVPKGCKVVHLDRDAANNDPKNLRIVDAETWGIMSANSFWTNSSDITKTGLIWSELYKAQKRRNEDGKADDSRP